MSSDGASAEPLAAEDPRQIGRFVVTGRVGAGAMGVVYAAYDPQLGRRVAVKLLAGDWRGPDEAWQGRLLREAQALAKLSHPNVVQVHEVGEHAGGVFLAMEYVPGVSLQTWLIRQKRSWSEIVAVFAEAGRGLAAAHAAGLVHRDVKPENLLVGDDGRVRVVDFGLARLEGEPEAEEGPAASLASAALASPTRTAPGALVGTPAYMSPEQFRGQPADALSDQFSLCVALYEALFGERPFVGSTAREVSRSVLSGEIAARRDATRVPGWLLRAVLRGLRGDRSARWPDVQALVDELSRDRSSRLRLARWTGAVLLGAGAVIAATSWAVDAQTRRGRERAEASAAAHLTAASANIDSLLAEGRTAQAAAVLEAFLAVPEHRGTQAVARALHEWGGRMKARGDRGAARISFARAYSAAADAETEAAVLGELAALFRDEWAWDALVSLCVVAGPAPSGHPRELACAEARLARRDLGGPFPGELAELGSILSSWSSGIRTDRSADVGGVIAGSDPPQLFTYHRGSGRLEFVRSDPSLTQVRSLTQPRLADRPGLGPVVLSPGSAPLALTWSAAQRRVAAVGEAGESLSFVADEPLAAAPADLDGDGARELYVGTGPFGRELLALHTAGGTWRVEHPHAGTDATNSDINALVAADLDGDGRDELAVAAGPWRAFDVRVLRPEPGAGLGLVARRKLGNVAALATLRLGDERVLVAAKTDAYPSRLAFPAGPAAGAPAGLYLLRLRGRELETVGLLAAPARAGAPRPHDFSRLLVGDIDADGRDDLVATALDPESGPLITCLFRQLDGGRFARATLGGLEPIALTNVDDDAALELVARGVGPGEGQLWLLGAGAERPTAPGAPARSPLPSLPSSQAPPLAAVSSLSDPILIRSWQRAEQLAALGLHAEAARSVDDLSRFSAEPQAHAHVLRRAAELYEAAGEFLAAAERFEGAAEELGTPALEGAARCYEQADRFADALRIDRLLELRSDLPRAEALRVRNRAQQLAEIVDGVPRAELLLEAALQQSWLFDDPLAVRRELSSRGLNIEAFAGRGPIVRAPVEWSSSTLGFSIELDLRRAEWGSGLLVGLRLPGSPSPVAAVGLEVLGGGGVYRRRLVCHTPGGREPHVLVEEPGDDTERPAQLRLELDVFPGLDLVTCSARVGPDAAPRTRRFQLGGDAPLAPGRYELVVLPRGFAAPSGLWSSAELRSVELRGASLVGGLDEGPRARAARLLIQGDFEATLAEPGLAPLWRAFALSELGRWPDASEELRRVSVDDPEVRADLATLLRTRGPTIAPILRAALGRRYLRLAWEAIEAAVTQHPDDRLIGRVLTTAFAELDEVEPHPDPRERPILARLLLERGRAWARLGQPERARRDLERAALLRGPTPDGLALEDIEVELAALALAGGALAEARGLARRALEAARARELVADRLRADPRFAALARDPDWLALLAD